MPQNGTFCIQLSWFNDIHKKISQNSTQFDGKIVGNTHHRSFTWQWSFYAKNRALFSFKKGWGDFLTKTYTWWYPTSLVAILWHFDKNCGCKSWCKAFHIFIYNIYLITKSAICWLFQHCFPHFLNPTSLVWYEKGDLVALWPKMWL